MTENGRSASSRTILVGQGFNLAEHAPLLIIVLMTIGARTRLIILPGIDITLESIIFEASAILLLAIAAAIITRMGRSK